MRYFSAVIWFVSVVIFAAGCGDPPPTLVEHPSAQTTTLRSKVNGCLLMESDEGAIIAIDLPGLAQAIVLPPRDLANSRHPEVYTLAGPDRQGRIAFVQGEWHPSHHRLKVINRDGTGLRQLFDRPGDPIWDHVVSKTIALSREGDIALVADMKGVQLHGAFLEQGSLQICHVADGSIRTIVPAALDWGLSWFPDSRHLAYVALAAVSQIPDFKPSDNIPIIQDPDRAPAVFVLDLDTGQSRLLCGGQSPVVADDGRSLLFLDYRYQPHRLWLDKGSIEPATVPYETEFVALHGDGTVIYQGYQTEEPPTFTKYYSPLAGRRELVSIKVGVLNTSQYQTLLPSFDFRHPISFSP